MPSFNQPPQTFPGNVDSLDPDAQGHNVAGLLHGQGISVSSTMNASDQTDTSLFITFGLEVTADPAGVTGWFELFGGTWQGGQTRTGVSPAPAMGPYQTSDWGALNISRLRVRVNPTRDVLNMSWNIIAN